MQKSCIFVHNVHFFKDAFSQWGAPLESAAEDESSSGVQKQNPMGV